MSNMIVQKGKGHYDEGVLSGVASPGMAMERTSGNTFVQLAIAVVDFLQGTTGLVVAIEDALQGRTAETAYVDGDVVFLYSPLPGDHIQVLLTDGEVIVDGDQVIPAGGGDGLWVKAAGTELGFVATAREALSPVGANALLSVEITSV